MSGSGNNNVEDGIDKELRDSELAVDKATKAKMTHQQAAIKLQSVFRGRRVAKKVRMNVADIANLALEDDKAYKKFSSQIAKKGLSASKSIEMKAAWVNNVNEYAVSESGLKRKQLYEIANGYFEAKDAMAGIKGFNDPKLAEAVANSYANLVSKRVKGEVSSNIGTDEYLLKMSEQLSAAMNILAKQNTPVDTKIIVEAAYDQVLKGLTEDHKSAHDRSGAFSKAVAIGAAPLTTPMKMARLGKTADKYVEFADVAIRGAYSGADKAVGNLLGKPAGKIAGVVAGGLTAAAVYTPTMIAEGLEAAAAGVAIGLGGAGVGVVGAAAGAALGVTAAAAGIAATGAAITAGAYGLRMLPRVLYRGAKKVLGETRDLAEAAGQGMNEGFRGMYNAHRFSNVEKEIASSMQTLDLLEEKINKDPNTPASVKQMLGEIKAKEMEYASGKMLKDGEIVSMTALDKAELLTKIQTNHQKLSIHIPQDKQRLFNLAYDDINAGISKQTALFAEVTSAREERDRGIHKVKTNREKELETSYLIRENKDAGLWNKTMGAYMDNFVNPMLLHMPKIIQNRFPEAVENAQKMSDAKAVERANDSLLTEIARDMGVGAVVALKPGAEIGRQGEKYNQQQIDVNLKLQAIENKREMIDRIVYGGLTTKEVEELNRASAAKEAKEDQDRVAAAKKPRASVMEILGLGRKKAEKPEVTEMKTFGERGGSMLNAANKSRSDSTASLSSVDSLDSGVSLSSRSASPIDISHDHEAKPTIFEQVKHAFPLDTKVKNAAKLAAKDIKINKYEVVANPMHARPESKVHGRGGNN